MPSPLLSCARSKQPQPQNAMTGACDLTAHASTINRCEPATNLLANCKIMSGYCPLSPSPDFGPTLAVPLTPEAQRQNHPVPKTNCAYTILLIPHWLRWSQVFFSYWAVFPHIMGLWSEKRAESQDKRKSAGRRRFCGTAPDYADFRICQRHALIEQFRPETKA